MNEQVLVENFGDLTMRFNIATALREPHLSVEYRMENPNLSRGFPRHMTEKWPVLSLNRCTNKKCDSGSKGAIRMVVADTAPRMLRALLRDAAMKHFGLKYESVRFGDLDIATGADLAHSSCDFSPALCGGSTAERDFIWQTAEFLAKNPSHSKADIVDAEMCRHVMERVDKIQSKEGGQELLKGALEEHSDCWVGSGLFYVISPDIGWRDSASIKIDKTTLYMSESYRALKNPSDTLHALVRVLNTADPN
jgi:hypothetical protein